LRKLNCEIRLCLDGDLAGQTAAMKASKQLQNAGLKVMIVDNQNSTRDPDEILNEDGEEALRKYLTNINGRIDFALNYFKNSNPLKTAEQKKKLIQEFLPILLSINSQLDFENYLRKLSIVTNYEVEALRKVVAKAKNTTDIEETYKIIEEYHPERKVLRKLELAERELLYQMLTNPEAVSFYEKNVNGFYDELYRQIANFLVDYARKNPNFSMFELTGAVELSDLDNKDSVVNEMTNLLLEKNHPVNCNGDLLDNLLSSINTEKEKIFEQDILESSLKGKDPLTQARLVAEYNRRKVNKLK
jgi:DNA primase